MFFISIPGHGACLEFSVSRVHGILFKLICLKGLGIVFPGQQQVLVRIFHTVGRHFPLAFIGLLQALPVADADCIFNLSFQYFQTVTIFQGQRDIGFQGNGFHPFQVRLRNITDLHIRSVSPAQHEAKCFLCLAKAAVCRYNGCLGCGHRFFGGKQVRLSAHACAEFCGR